MSEVQADLKKCARYEDFKDLYKKTVEPMAKYCEAMENYGLEHRQMTAMIAQFDETIAMKASKTDHLILTEELEKRVTSIIHENSVKTINS